MKDPLGKHVLKIAKAVIAMTRHYDDIGAQPDITMQQLAEQELTAMKDDLHKLCPGITGSIVREITGEKKKKRGGVK